MNVGSILLLVAGACIAVAIAGAWPAVRRDERLRAWWARFGAGAPGSRKPAEPGLADEIEHAIEDQQFFLAHQPKLRARTGVVDGVEVLVRWRHPHRGLIAPNDFIGLAEQHGTIRALTEWVIRQTLVEQRRLAACGHLLAFNVNISARLLADRDFATWALETVRGASGPIGFEITETAMIKDPAGALRNLHLFADAGIRISIDDYGAGLSSLAYLKQLPANELKIDRMFISSLSSSHRDPLLVRSTIDLAHALDMEVVAEGVDSPASQALLKVMGCDILQGFLIATPMPLGELRAFLDTRAAAGTTVVADFNWLGGAARNTG